MHGTAAVHHLTVVSILLYGLSVPSVVTRNSSDCTVLLAPSSWLPPLDKLNVCGAVCQLYYLHINGQAHGVEAAANHPWTHIG